ncbi:MAG: hypothetical protein ACRYG2_12305 [Janthinobacterium lividum]
MTVPLVLVVLGRVDLSASAALGALSSVHGVRLARDRPHVRRNGHRAAEPLAP